MNRNDLSDMSTNLYVQQTERTSPLAFPARADTSLTCTQRESWFREIFQSAPEGMLVVDQRGTILEANLRVS
jgi:PAS domain-containing protein